MKIAVIYALKDINEWIEFEMPEGASVREAIDQSGILKDFPEIDLNDNRVGIFSKIVKLDQILQDGNRVEIYRKLIADPKLKKKSKPPRS